MAILGVAAPGRQGAKTQEYQDIQMISNRTTSRVRYGDTDRMGYAYYANYLRWFEIGRSELFRALGMTYREIEEKGVFLPVSEAYCKYLFPVRYDDPLVIETTLDTAVKGAMKFDYRLLSEDLAKVFAAGYTKHPCVTPDGRVMRPPKFLRDFITRHIAEAG